MKMCEHIFEKRQRPNAISNSLNCKKNKRWPIIAPAIAVRLFKNLSVHERYTSNTNNWLMMMPISFFLFLSLSLSLSLYISIYLSIYLSLSLPPSLSLSLSLSLWFVIQCRTIRYRTPNAASINYLIDSIALFNPLFVKHSRQIAGK